jgi:GNAT superfamily N-acetyltransferase
MKIKISLLKNCVSAIPQLTKICFNTLGKWSPGVSRNEMQTWFNEWKNEGIPLALVAMKDDTTPVGMCSLQMNDGIRPDLSPWLGDLCIDPTYQKKGIGKFLIDAAKDKTKELGFKELYLFTPDYSLPNYYVNLGWNIIGEDEYHNNSVTIMEIKL